jgi:hypothetical protein
VRYLFFIAHTIVPVALPSDADAIDYAKSLPHVYKIVNAETGTTIWRKPTPLPSEASGEGEVKG